MKKDNPKLVIASNNKHKIQEIKDILGEEFECFSLSEMDFYEEIPETEDTFLKNAMIKASTISKKLGVFAIADDSGLCVEALNGEPGVYSARYASLDFCSHSYKKGKVESVGTEPCDDKNNNLKLLKALKGQKNRKAFYVSSCVLWFHDGRFLHGEGRVYGEILTDFRGEGGFGYDPLFYHKGLNKTFAEITMAEKNLISHRKLALQSVLNTWLSLKKIN